MSGPTALAIACVILSVMLGLTMWQLVRLEKNRDWWKAAMEHERADRKAAQEALQRRRNQQSE